MRNPEPSAGLPDAEVLTPADVQTVLGLSPNMLTRWADAGVIASFRTLGGHRRFRRADVEALRVRLHLQQADPFPRRAATGSDGDLLGAELVARLVGVHRKTLARWSDDGTLPARYRTPGGHRRWRRADVDRFLADRRSGQPRAG